MCELFDSFVIGEITMNKFKFTPAGFNSLKRDPSGTKVQHVWAKDFRGLGADLGKTKKSLIYRYKSPESGKFRIMTLDSFTRSDDGRFHQFGLFCNFECLH